jgi:hypothetical protein
MESRQLLSSTCGPQRTSSSFKNMIKVNKFGTPSLNDTRLDRSINL